MPTSTGSNIAPANDALRQRQYSAAIKKYIRLLAKKPELHEIVSFNFIFARRRWRLSHRGQPLRLAICGWDMTDASAQRLRTLVDNVSGFSATEIIGATFPSWGDKTFQPIVDMALPTHLIHVTSGAAFQPLARELVCDHPYDTIILSKPRFPDIVLGLLYKLVWDAHVIVDVDDERLAAEHTDKLLALDALLTQEDACSHLHDLGNKDLTRVALALWEALDSGSLSDMGLQARHTDPNNLLLCKAKSLEPTPCTELFADPQQAALFQALGGWHMLAVTTPSAHRLSYTPGTYPSKTPSPISQIPQRVPQLLKSTAPAEPKSAVPHLLPKTIPNPSKWTEPGKPRGGINDTSGALLKGWLALPGDHAPRKGLLKFDDHTVYFTADQYRNDLKDRGINDGRHGFQVQVPFTICDGKEREVVLVDEATGLEIARRFCRWKKVTRDYQGFQGFLKASMTQPEIQVPFLEQDKRAFAMMENIANRLCHRALALAEKPLVSVIMPMFNRATIVTQAISSVLNQTYVNFELIVVDDGSIDNSVEVVLSIADPRIHLIPLAKNCGQTIARNTGLRAAQGSILAYLDSDNTWDERYLAAIVGAFDQLPKADLIYSGALLYIGSASSPYAVRYGHLHRALLENRNYIDTNVIAHRRGLLDLIGGFDESLHRFPDWDLILRATEIGSVFSIPVILCHYYYGKVANVMTHEGVYANNSEIIQQKQRDRKKARLLMLDRKELVRPVSVIVPNWESLDDIRDCIEALCARDWKGMLDLIVVDNASTTEVQHYLQKQQDLGRIRFIPLDKNYGFSFAVNAGIECARLDSDVLLLNNDAVAQPGSLQALQQACLSRPDAGMTVPRQILPGGTKTIRTHVPYARAKIDCDVNISAHHRNVANAPLFHDGGELELNYAPFFAVYIRREVIEKIGVLDAEYGRHYRSDRVYCMMMRAFTTYRIFYVPDSHFIHKLQKATDQLRTSGSQDKSFDLMFQRNQWDANTSERLGYRAPAWDVF